jgi:hypothetical protein
MKTNYKIKIINKIWVLIMSLALTTVLSAQNASLEQASSKENKLKVKEQKVALLQQKYDATSALLDNRNFVFDVNNIRNTGGRFSGVPSGLTFIEVDSTEATFQIGTYNSRGNNGLGGYTAKGLVTKWEVEKNDAHKYFTLLMQMRTTTAILLDIKMIINADGSASATLFFDSGWLYLDGQIVSEEQSRAVEGNPI